MALSLALARAGDRSPATGEQEGDSTSHTTLSLNGRWAVTALPLAAVDESGYELLHQTNASPLEAQVPGEIHLDLMRAGRMDDPDVSDNARRLCRWPEEFSWWYRTEFIVPPAFRRHLRQQLVFDGIDLFGQVFVNGKFVGATRDAFTSDRFNVKPFLRPGTNELVVRVTSGTELAPAGDRGHGFSGLYALRSFDQRRFLRKPAYAYGWDWCDPLPNIGIWRGVRLEAHSKVVIHHVRLDTVIHDHEVALEGEVVLDNLHPWSGYPCQLILEVQPPTGPSIVQRTELQAQVGHFPVPCRMVIPNPQLWWPNGMGDQPLYRVTARVTCGADETDRQQQTIGLRTVELDRSRLPDGFRFCFKINGQEVYCKGGNWAPADLIPARIDAARYEKLVAEAKAAHFTMFRVNGVGLYESDSFYDACDRAGILVWQDFTFSCFQYPDQDRAFTDLVRSEVESVVKRLRPHPSLVLWNANNECTWGMADWWGCDPQKPEEIGGVRIYHEIIPDLCHFLDPARPYWPGSSSGGEDPNSETAGDCHWWDKFGNSPDVSRRIRHEVVDECRARFVSEYGIIGPPHLDSVREYLKPGELSRDSAAWKIHVNSMDRGTTDAGIAYHYGDPSGLSLPDYLLYGQVFQAGVQGGAMEAMRFRKHDPEADCEGTLVWSYNDCWGEMGWSILDHYLRRKASYYGVKRACLPVKVIVRPRDGALVTRVVNDTLQPRAGVVRCGWVRLDGTTSEWEEHPVSVPANSMAEVTRALIPPKERRPPADWLYAATLTAAGIPDDQSLWLFAPVRELALATPVLSSAQRGNDLEILSSVYCHAVHVEDGGHKLVTDNYFDLIPGVPHRVQVDPAAASNSLPWTAVQPIRPRPRTTGE